MKQDIIKKKNGKYCLYLTIGNYPDFITVEESILDNMDESEFKSFLDQIVEVLRNGGSKIYSSIYNKLLLRIEKDIAHKSYGTVKFSFVIRGSKRLIDFDSIFKRLKYIETKYGSFNGCNPESTTWIEDKQLLKYIIENKPSKVSNSTYLRIFLLDFYELL